MIVKDEYIEMLEDALGPLDYEHACFRCGWSKANMLQLAELTNALPSRRTIHKLKKYFMAEEAKNDEST